MALRSSWEGFLRLNLISVPVKAYSATQSGGGRIGFHLIHAKCNNRIRYQKVCPVHGDVPNEEIVSGYEVARGQYVLIKPEDLKKLRVNADKSIDIDVFIRPEEIDPLYFTERSYYLTPSGKAGQRPYAVLQKVMADEQRYAVGAMVLAGREQMVLIRPVKHLLTATVLNYADRVKPASAFEDETPKDRVANDEVKLARTLIEATTEEKFDFEKYQDKYASQVLKLIERRSTGRRPAAPRADHEPAIINLMDALRGSLKETKRRSRRGTKAGRNGRLRRTTPRRKTG